MNNESGRKGYNAIKIFSATMAKERSNIGEVATDWISTMSRHKGFDIVDTTITQSSDNEFHCLTIAIFYKVGG